MPSFSLFDLSIKFLNRIKQKTRVMRVSFFSGLIVAAVASDVTLAVSMREASNFAEDLITATQVDTATDAATQIDTDVDNEQFADLAKSAGKMALTAGMNHFGIDPKMVSQLANKAASTLSSAADFIGPDDAAGDSKAPNAAAGGSKDVKKEDNNSSSSSDNKAK